MADLCLFVITLSSPAPCFRFGFLRTPSPDNNPFSVSEVAPFRLSPHPPQTFSYIASFSFPPTEILFFSPRRRPLSYVFRQYCPSVAPRAVPFTTTPFAFLGLCPRVPFPCTPRLRIPNPSVFYFFLTSKRFCRIFFFFFSP